MRKSILFLFLIFRLTVLAQSISVSSFKLLDTDLTANTAGTMEQDQNGETAALIKVVTTQTGFTFDGGALGIVKTVQKPSEIWVYVPRGLKKITISHPQLGMLRDYYLNVPIEAARTYEMILIAGEVQTVVKQARTSQYVVFQLTPPDAVVELNGELLKTEGGVASKMMKFGTYNYRVQAPDYLLEAGSVTVDDPNNKKVVNISLKPNFAKVTINVDNNAEIWVNGERKGVGSWSGNLGAGTYELEAKKQGHRSTTTTQDFIVTSEPQIVKLQSPTPIYGEADINSSPGMADIFIDGKKVGQTPLMISDLLVGQHEVRISKQGYSDYNSTLTVNEDETSILTVNLEKPTGNLEFTVGTVSFTMVQVDGGTFLMGATSEQVKLSTYYIGETEVTQALWETVMGNNPSNFKGNNRPVEKVSWDDCQLFIKKLNQKTGRKFRLPTEAEWEFAARGGNESHGYIYSGSNNVDKVSWYYDNSKKKKKWQSHIVKTKQANELGLYDMSGNVCEWCYWNDNYNIIGNVYELYKTGSGYNSDSRMNPTRPSMDSLPVVRGGHWGSEARFCNVLERIKYKHDTRLDSLGLRLALDL